MDLVEDRSRTATGVVLRQGYRYRPVLLFEHVHIVRGLRSLVSQAPGYPLSALA